MWQVGPNWTPGAHPKLLYHSPPLLDRGEKIGQQAHGSKQGQGDITHQLPSRAKQTQLDELI